MHRRMSGRDTAGARISRRRVGDDRFAFQDDLAQEIVLVFDFEVAAGSELAHFLFEKFEFDALALADVLEHAHGGNQLALLIEHGCCRDTHGDPLARAIETEGLQSLDDFSGHDFFAKFISFYFTLRRRDRSDFPNNLCRWPTKQTFRGGVPHRDLAFQIRADDSHWGGMDESTELLIPSASGGFARGSDEVYDIVGGEEQNRGGAGGGCRGHDLHCDREPVDGLPDGNHFHKMSRPAAHDEDPEGPKKIRIRKVRAGATHQPYQSCGDDHVGKPDDEVGDDIRPEQTLVAKVAIPMGEKVRREKSPRTEPDQSSQRKESDERHLRFSCGDGKWRLRNGRGAGGHRESYLSFAARSERTTRASFGNSKKGRVFVHRGKRNRKFREASE